MAYAGLQAGFLRASAAMLEQRGEKEPAEEESWAVCVEEFMTCSKAQIRRNS